MKRCNWLATYQPHALFQVVVFFKCWSGLCWSKASIALFVCMVSKSIHLEAVTSLTSEAFIAKLKILVSRWGNPTNMYIVNGTNLFVSQLFNDAISTAFNYELNGQQNYQTSRRINSNKNFHLRSKFIFFKIVS